jgi:hypothetical protein
MNIPLIHKKIRLKSIKKGRNLSHLCPSESTLLQAKITSGSNPMKNIIGSESSWITFFIAFLAYFQILKKYAIVRALSVRLSVRPSVRLSGYYFSWG